MTGAESVPRPPGAVVWSLPLVMLLFIGSGAAALIYEVVWLQLLQLSIGSSALSVGVLLGTFMGGMCLGSFLLPRFLKPAHHPLRVYAFLEAGIGLLGLASLYLVPMAGRLYTTVAGSGPASVFLRALVAAAVLLPPTLLMGATLPAIARWVRATPRGVQWLGFFYAGNIAGAVAGCLLAGFYLLRVFNMATAAFVAVGLNLLVAGLAFLLARPAPPVIIEETPTHAGQPPGSRLIYLAIALSGFTALGAEVIWTRLLALLYGGTTYTFSLILAVFLTGLGIGSGIGARLARGLASSSVALGWCQAGLCLALAWGAYATGAALPFWPVNPQLNTGNAFKFQLDVMRTLFALLPAAVLWGMSFPLAVGALAGRGQDAGRLVGGVYAANTLGAVLGALVTGLVLVGTVGSSVAQQIFILLAAVAAFAAWFAGARPDGMPGRLLWQGTAATLAATFVLAVPPPPALLIAYGRYVAVFGHQSEVIYAEEGVTASVAVSRTAEGVVFYHNAGKAQASSRPHDMRLQRMLGHITTLAPRNPEKVLVIGCGAGVTAGAVSIDPRVKKEIIAEIEPVVPRIASRYFGDHNFHVISNPKVSVHLDDARHYLLTTDEKFDAITSDPLDAWVKGSATLHTREFFEEVKQHLRPGGVVTVWVPLYENTEASVKSEIATFFEVFPEGAIFANTIGGLGYDLVLFGQLEGAPIQVDEAERRLEDAAHPEMFESLREIGILSAVTLFGTYAGNRADLREWLQDAEINTDGNLRLQYLAGLGASMYRSGPIFREMVRNVRYPENLFEGDPETLRALRNHIEGNLSGGRPF